jgi:cell division protein FtsZ
VLNEKLLEVMGDDVTREQAFAHANDVLKNAVGGISDIIHIPGLVNVDFEDVKTVMSEPGKAMWPRPPPAAPTAPPRPPRRPWPARCWKASTSAARAACWC